MGAWFRMKADFDISHYSHDTQVILTAFKVHGLIVADNGSNWYFGGSADVGWPEGVLDELKSIPAGAFEAVDMSPLMVSPGSGQARSVTSGPTVNIFAGTPAPKKAAATPIVPPAPAAAPSTTVPTLPPTSTTTPAAVPAPTAAGTHRAVAAAPARPAQALPRPMRASAGVVAAGSVAMAGLGVAGWLAVRRRHNNLSSL